jgi:hypothetical protein
MFRKTERTPEEAALRAAQFAAIGASIDLPGLYRGAGPGKIARRLAELAAGGGTAEVTGQTSRTSIGGALGGELIAGPVGAVIGGSRHRTQVVVRDGAGGVKVTEVRDAQKAYAFTEAFAAYAAIVAGGTDVP